MLQRLKAVFATLLIIATGLLAGAAEAQQPAANPRIALVVGNATYRDAALATPANDAGLVAQTLQSAGFDVVGARDLDGQSLRTALRDFLQKAAAAGPDMQAFVYLAGRAIQYNGDNYFVPVDAQINRDADVPIEAIRIADFSHALAATPGRARIIVLDAARANPYATQGSPLAPGLALVDPERGELIAFNAAPGTLAGDEEGPYGVYGKTLAGAIRQGGVDIVQAFDQTRVSVNAETQGALLPWSASKLGAPFYVFERAADAPPPALSFAETERRPISSFSAEDAYAAAVERDTLKGYREFLAAYPNSDQARRVRAILAVRREAAYWRRTVGADTPRAYWTYLHTYPKGPHIPDARRRLAMLSAEFEPPPDFRPEAFADLPPPPPDELVYDDRPIYAFDDFGPPPPPPPVQYGYVEDDDWRDLPPPPPPAEIGLLPVLGVALPIAIGAVAFQHGFHHDGIAPRGQPQFRRAAFAPPPLPANIKPVAPPAPVAAAAPVANAAVVKPLRPMGRRGQPGGPGAAQAKPAGAPTAPAPAPAAPGQAPKPVPPAAGAPAVAPPSAAGANAPGIHAAPGGKPLPTPSAPPAAAVAPVAPTAPGGKPPPAVPGGKPLPTPVAPPATATAPVAPTAPGGKPLPTPVAPPTTATAPIAPITPGGKPLRTAPGGKPSAKSWSAARGRDSAPRARCPGRQAGPRGGPTNTDQSGRVSCPGSEAGTADASDQPGAEAECCGAAAGRSPACPGPAAARSPRSCTSGSRACASASSGRAARAPSDARGDAHSPGASSGPSHASSCAAAGSRASAAGSPRTPAAGSGCAAGASPAAARGSSAAAGRPTASVRKTWVAAVSEVGLVR